MSGARVQQEPKQAGKSVPSRLLFEGREYSCPSASFQKSSRISPARPLPSHNCPEIPKGLFRVARNGRENFWPVPAFRKSLRSSHGRFCEAGKGFGVFLSGFQPSKTAQDYSRLLPVVKKSHIGPFASFTGLYRPFQRQIPRLPAKHANHANGEASFAFLRVVSGQFPFGSQLSTINPQLP